MQLDDRLWLLRKIAVHDTLPAGMQSSCAHFGLY